MPFKIPCPGDTHLGCTGCALSDIGQGFTEVEGSGSRAILVVGEAAGFNEAKCGLPFRPEAEAGSVLQMALRRAQVQRESLAICNIVRCLPPKMWLLGAPYEHEAINHCRQYMDEAVRKYKPRVILALGEIALRTLTGLSGKNLSVTSIRGFILNSPQYDLPVVASLHPSFIRRMGMAQLDVLTNDIILAAQVADGKISAEIPDLTNVLYDPPAGDLEHWIDYIREEGGPVAYDIETAYSIKQMDDSDVAMEDDAITEIQFSVAPKQAIVLPWSEKAKWFTWEVMQLPVQKWGWNSAIFDSPILRKQGIKIAEPNLDLMDAWHCLQPDLPRGLQFVASFFCPEIGPWKHKNQEDKIFYCFRDVDSLQRIGRKLLPDLEKRGVARAFYGHIVKLRPILDRMCERGLPVDVVEQQWLRAELETEMIAINIQIQSMAPKELQAFDPSSGFAQWPKPAQDILTVLELKGKKDLWRDVYKQFQISYEAGGELQRKVVHSIELASGMTYRKFNEVYRWARTLEFNPASSKQMIGYAKFKGYAVPKVERSNGIESEQANEQVILEWAEKHNDELCKLVIDYKKRQKIIGTYIDGFKSNGDGRIHSTITFAPATGQLSSHRPSIMNFPKHGEFAKKIRKTIKAREGFKLIEIDMKSFHARTLGFEAGCENYMRLASLDIHSFVAAHFIKHQIDMENAKKRHSSERLAEITQMVEDVSGLDKWLSLPDAELDARLGNIKSKYKSLRDKKAKPAILGIGFGLGVTKLHKMNKDSFDSVKEAKEVITLIQHLFPKIFQYQEMVKTKAHQQGYLLSKHGYLRRFFEVKRFDFKYQSWKAGESAEAAIAFQPANIAFGEMRDRLIELEEKGLLEKYSFINMVHDSVIFECPDALVGECVQVVSAILERPSTVLIDPRLGAFSCPCEASVGQDWSQLVEWKL